MTNTTVCAFCASVIPAGAKTCPMCGADNQPDYLQEIVAPEPVVKPAPILEPEPIPLADPFRDTPVRESPARDAPALDRSASPAASPARYIWILVGVVAAVLVCLCVAAVLISNLVLGA